MSRSHRCCMRRRAVVGPPVRRRPWDAGGFRWSPPRQASRVLPSAAASPNSRPCRQPGETQPDQPRIRRPGVALPRRATDPALLQELQRLIDPATRGDPMSPLLWTCKSTRNLADDSGRVSATTSVIRRSARLLTDLGYSLQANRKTEEGKDHPDRNAQFEHINRKVQLVPAAWPTVVSVDTKKKEWVGNYKNPGQEWQPKGQPQQVSPRTSRTRNWAKCPPTASTT